MNWANEGRSAFNTQKDAHLEHGIDTKQRLVDCSARQRGVEKFGVESGEHIAARIDDGYIVELVRLHAYERNESNK